MIKNKTSIVLVFTVLLFLICLLPINIKADDVIGTVTDSDTGVPLPNVVVKILETGDSTKTDNNGNYFIPNVVNGSYTLLVGALNYTPLVFTRTIGSCCVGIRGNVNGDPADQIDISDLVFLVGFMFQSGVIPPCMEEADINGSGGVAPIDISDLVTLVAYMFQGGTDPSPCF